jgi:solute:Na+ symporter, SSS family
MILWIELAVFTLLFAVVTVLGFAASRWKRGATLDHLDEWGLTPTSPACARRH